MPTDNRKDNADHTPSPERIERFKEMVSIKCFKHMPSLSEETLCFTAKVCFNGKTIGRASNNGHGGATQVYIDRTKIDWQKIGLWLNWDELVDALSFQELRKWEEEKAKNRITYALKKHIVFTKKGEEFKGRHFIFSNGNSSPEMAQRVRNRIAEMPDADLILNDHPVEVALPYFLKDA